MRQIFAKTFGGLSQEYYVRQLIFGSIILAMSVSPILLASIYYPADFHTVPLRNVIANIAIMVVNTLLYPYSRFVYENIAGYILGRNIFLIHGCLVLVWKFVTMSICWCFAIFIAPVGLVYLIITIANAVRSAKE